MLLLLALSSLARPPTQTATQQKVLNSWAQDAHTKSAAAKPHLLSILESSEFRKEISSVSVLKNKTSAQLLEILFTEIHTAQISHNVGMRLKLERNLSSSGSGSGVAWGTVRDLKYIPTCWDEMVEGILKYDIHYTFFNGVEVHYFNYPSFLLLPPHAPAAYDRPVYTAMNIWKKAVGTEFGFGDVSLITENNASRIFISPIDSGLYAENCGGWGESLDNMTAKANPCTAWDKKTYGTANDFYHIVMPHLDYFGCPLSSLFLRWFAGGKICSSHGYFEGEYSATFEVPEALLLTMLRFDTLWGSSDANLVRSWSKSLSRPLGWGQIGEHVWVIDADVNNTAGQYRISSNDTHQFLAEYSKKVDFDTMRKTVSHHLTVSSIGYNNKHICDAIKCSGCKFLGVDGGNLCVYTTGK